MSATDAEVRIREYIISEFGHLLEGTELDVDRNLLGDVIDSMGVMQLVVFLEEGFNVRIPDEDILPANFRSVRSLVGLVLGKSSSDSQAPVG